MSSISIEQPPSHLDEELRSYLNRRFIDVNLALQDTNILDQSNILPNAPVNGTIKYFKQAIGVIITQPGFWGFEEGIWIKL